ncbi:MAG: hypothetical protein EON56_03890 [Alphaproteobacteria bacterium]|nr:MAG: hypothetical protein EON56_03890 [Alphaproteobacteria bacterium]
MRAQAILDAEIQSELRRRMAALEVCSYAELRALPAASTESAFVLGKNVKLTTFRESHPNGRLLVLVRSDRPIFLGFGSAGRTEGFWIDPSGAKTAALHEEIAEYYA